MTAHRYGSAATSACLVLMFKSPARSKRRLAAAGYGAASSIAERLLDCALEDLAGWPGPVCYAPADAEAEAALQQAAARQGHVLLQGDGNLGERITHINEELVTAGTTAQIFIGIDCPSLTPAYLDAAGAALTNTDVVLGPAHDGGVVLMGVDGRWPPLAGLPWSEPGLHDALRTACERAGLRCATLATLGDLDTVADIERLGRQLGADERPARRALLEQIGSAATFAGRVAS